MSKKKLLFITLFSVVLLIIVLIVVGVVLWNIGFLQIWVNGFDYYDERAAEYSYSKSVDTNVYTFLIDLDNPKSNKGKVVYNKDGCKVYIDELQKGSGGENNYVLWLKSEGQFSLDSAKNVTGYDHLYCQYPGKRRNGGGLSLSTEINGVVYSGDETGGQTFNNGDLFGYFIVNSNDYDFVHNMLRGKVRVSITNLAIEKWERN